MYERRRFHIKVGDSNVGVIQFDEVIGLDIEEEWIGQSDRQPFYERQRMPLQEEGYDSIVFRGGNIQGDRFLLEFFMGRGIDKLNPKTITLTLLDKRSNAIQRWVFEEAFPTGVQLIQQAIDNHNIFIESVSIVFKNVEVEAFD